MRSGRPTDTLVTELLWSYLYKEKNKQNKTSIQYNYSTPTGLLLSIHSIHKLNVYAKIKLNSQFVKTNFIL